MNKLIPTLVLFLVMAQCYGQVDRDKMLHFVGGNLFGLAGAGIAKQISDGNRYWTFAGAVGGGILIGLSKEAVDSGQQENGWDNDDLLATILGGVTVGFTIDIFTDHGRNKRRLANSSKHKHKIFDLTDRSAAELNIELPESTLPSLNYLSIPNSLR